MPRRMHVEHGALPLHRFFTPRQKPHASATRCRWPGKTLGRAMLWSEKKKSSCPLSLAAWIRTCPLIYLMG